MNQTLAESMKWTTADVELLFKNEWKRYEIIGGELFVSISPHWNHQQICGNICVVLEMWSRQTQLGESVISPGIIYTESDNVIPDVVWVSREKLVNLLDSAGHLTGSPELVVEVLSPGKENERRDKQAKLKLYSTQGVQEYWIVDRHQQQVQVYRRQNHQLVLAETLSITDCFAEKILANADRWIDASVESRDLIDLAVLRLNASIPPQAIAKSESAYPVIEPLKEAIANFQQKPNYRDKCFQSLKINNPVTIINGLDLLAVDFGL